MRRPNHAFHIAAALTAAALAGCAGAPRAASTDARPADPLPSAAPAAARGDAHTLFTDFTPGPDGGHDAHDAADNLAQATFARDGADFDPDVSRDGRWLVFASTQHRPTADLYVKPVRGQTVTQLTTDAGHDVMPEFSPDGSRIAFASNRAGSWDIFVVGAGGGQPVQITSEGSHELHPTWSPDGSMLAYCRLNPGSGRWELWVLEVANPGVARFIGHGLLPEWNPTGNTIAFQRSRERGDRFYSVWTLNYENGEATAFTEVASSPDFACVNPTWSPEGDRLAFAAVDNPGGPIVGGLGYRPLDSQIWIVNADGSSRTRLTGGGFINVIPRWGHDGRIYFVSNRSGLDNIWAVAPDRALATAAFHQQNAPEPAQRPHAVSSHHDHLRHADDLAPRATLPPLLDPRSANPDNHHMADAPAGDHEDAEPHRN